MAAVVLVDLSTGQRALEPADLPFVDGNAGDSALVGRLLREHCIAAVIQLAGSILVAESIAVALKYYRNNTAATQNLIEICPRDERRSRAELRLRPRLLCA